MSIEQLGRIKSPDFTPCAQGGDAHFATQMGVKNFGRHSVGKCNDCEATVYGRLGDLWRTYTILIHEEQDLF
jgi:hypothetical protein